jgi:hypothetical protein
MSLHSIPSGRLLIRALPHGQIAVVGTLHLPPTVTVTEGVAYLLLLTGDRAALPASPLDAGLPDELAGQGIDASLRAPIWHATAVPGALSVRFISAFPGANGWTVYGAANLPIPATSPDASGHAWLDIADGVAKTIPAPVDAYGETPAQMLTSHPVWPSPDGRLYTLSQHDRVWREHYHRMSQLMARCGAGDIDQTDLHSQLNADPFLSRIRAWGYNQPSYLHYLAILDAAGGLVRDDPRAAEQDAEHWALVERCLIESQAVDA